MRPDQQIPVEIRISIAQAFEKELDIVAQLSQHINLLITNDFNGLLNILYRLDVSEDKIRNALKENPENDGGNMLAALIIERQLKKLETRKSFRRDENISDDEKWP